jgi:hypothetical protein
MPRHSSPTLPGDPLLAPLHALADALRTRRLILFAGGGVSQSLGLPDFRELIHHIARELGFEQTAASRAEYPVIAEAFVARHGHLGPLRSWMDTTWHPSSVDITRSELHNLIVDLDFPTIYTTNYDRWLELAFDARQKPFRKIANVADLTAFGEPRTEIIKFHGDFENDDSLVLTEASYFRRMSFESPLDIRLRADALARPILFLGYSLHDTNMRYLLFRLQQLWEDTVFAAQRPLSYIFMLEHDPAQEVVLRRRGIEPIVAGDAPDPGQASARFLRQLLELSQAQRSEDGHPPPAPHRAGVKRARRP